MNHLANDVPFIDAGKINLLFRNVEVFIDSAYRGANKNTEQKV